MLRETDVRNLAGSAECLKPACEVDGIWRTRLLLNRVTRLLVLAPMNDGS